MLKLAREITKKTPGALILAGTILFLSLPGAMATGGLFGNPNNTTNTTDSINPSDNAPALRDAAPDNQTNNKPVKKSKKLAAKKESAAKKKALAYDVIKEKKEENKEPAGEKANTGNKPFILTRVFAFTIGWALGTPVAVVRRSHVEILEANKDLLGDTDKWYFIIPAGALTVPFGLTSGIASGCGFGAKDAWIGSGEEKPFNKDLFSLGDMQ